MVIDSDAVALSDQRRHPRVSLILKIAYPSRDSFLADYASNASQGGLFISTEKRFEIGDRFQIELSFPGLLEPIACRVEVRWQRAVPEGESTGSAGFGVAFCFEDECQAEHIRSLLAELTVQSPPPAQAERPAPFRVLVVEDNPLVREMLMFAVRKLHRTQLESDRLLELTEAENGQAAWTQLGSERFDLAIVDYFMPVMNGHQLIQRIRQDERHAMLPIIVVSTGDPQVQREAVEVGADMFLKKPLVLSMLLGSMLRLLGLDQADKEASDGSAAHLRG